MLNILTNITMKEEILLLFLCLFGLPIIVGLYIGIEQIKYNKKYKK
jgi:hypothetical protein